jgi:flavin-dependent dehydrogenase
MAILAGGPRYVLQGRLGMGRPRDFLKTAQVEVPARGLEETNVFVGARIAPGSFAWVVPFEKDGRKLARIGVSSKESGLPYLRNLLERLRAEGHLDYHDFPIRPWVIPITPLRRTYAHRVLAVGDAAGQVKPTTGGGIYFSLLCAESTAKIAILALDRSKFEEEFLGRYEKEWRSKLATEIGIGYFCRRLAERFTDQEMDQLFRVLQSDGILSSMQNRIRFDWHKELIWFALRHPTIGQAFRRKIFQCLMGAEPSKELVDATKKHGLWFLRPRPAEEDSTVLRNSSS